MSATYTQAQTIYTFTLSANALAGKSFDNTDGAGLPVMQAYAIQVEALLLADPTIQGLIGADWRPVWGPVVYAADTSGATVHADNTMGCYYSPSNNLFVIAVAGTNANSPFDWLDEDLLVHTMVSWNAAGGTSSGNISKGANVGLQILLSMKNGGGATMLQALSSYISSNSINSATVAVGGHSLGGALSPCLALYMQQNQASWDPKLTQAIAVYPTAGPTPGDSEWASNYDSFIQNGIISYTSLYNTLDVVPCAWALTDLETIPAIYDDYIVPPKFSDPKDAFTGIVACMLQLNACSTTTTIDKKNVPKNPYTQVSQGRSPLTGTFDQTVDGDITTKMKDVGVALGSLRNYATYLTDVVRFLAQAGAQHTTAYPPLLGISAFESEYQTILGAVFQETSTSNTATTDGLHRAVKKLTGIDLMKLLGGTARGGAPVRARS